MSKYNFLSKTNTLLNKLGLNIDIFIEHSIKISPTHFNSDRVNFKISFDKISYEELIIISYELFGFDIKIFNFIKDYYNKDIKYIFFGYNGGNYELYFEKWIKDDGLYNNMTEIISYDIQEDIIFNYKPFDINIDNNIKLINNLIELYKKYDIDLSNDFKSFGYIKNNGNCYLSYFECNSLFNEKLKKICRVINTDNSISNYIDKNIFNITFIGYSIKNDSLSISIYYK